MSREPTGLTLEEQERWAYANGDHERARLLALVIDTLEDPEDDTLEADDDAEFEADKLKEKADRLKEKVEELTKQMATMEPRYA